MTVTDRHAAEESYATSEAGAAVLVPLLEALGVPATVTRPRGNATVVRVSGFAFPRLLALLHPSLEHLYRAAREQWDRDGQPLTMGRQGARRRALWRLYCVSKEMAAQHGGEGVS